MSDELIVVDVARAMHKYGMGDPDPLTEITDMHRDLASAAIAAAEPHIELALLRRLRDSEDVARERCRVDGETFGALAHMARVEWLDRLIAEVQP